eukprot:1106-Heterococcus_DN1.PRE.3
MFYLTSALYPLCIPSSACCSVCCNSHCLLTTATRVTATTTTTDPELERDLECAAVIPHMLSADSSQAPQQQQQQQQPQLVCASALFCPGDELRGLLSEDNFPRQDFADQQLLPVLKRLGLRDRLNPSGVLKSANSIATEFAAAAAAAATSGTGNGTSVYCGATNRRAHSLLRYMNQQVIESCSTQYEECMSASTSASSSAAAKQKARQRALEMEKQAVAAQWYLTDAAAIDTADSSSSGGSSSAAAARPRCAFVDALVSIQW